MLEIDDLVYWPRKKRKRMINLTYIFWVRDDAGGVGAVEIIYITGGG